MSVITKITLRVLIDSQNDCIPTLSKIPNRNKAMYAKPVDLADDFIVATVFLCSATSVT